MKRNGLTPNSLVLTIVSGLKHFTVHIFHKQKTLNYFIFNFFNVRLKEVLQSISITYWSGMPIFTILATNVGI